MYRLIIVDDEEIVRNGLAYFLDWNAFGFELSASFEDGKEAIAYLEKEHIDVILTDINMAEIDGLSLAKWVNQQRLATKIVLISGHQQFEYAKRAIEYNVNHYLLKPTKYEEMAAVFSKLREELDEEFSRRSLLEEEQSRFSDVLPLLHEQFVADLASGLFATSDSKLARAALVRFEFDLASHPCCLLHTELSFGADADSSVKQRHHALLNMLKSSNSLIRFYCVHTYEKRITLAAVSTNQDAVEVFKEKLGRQINQLTSHLRRLFQFDLFIISKMYFPSLLELSELKETAPAEQTEKTELSQKPLMPDSTELLAMLLEGKQHGLEDKLDEWTALLQTYPLTAVRRFFIDLFAKLTQDLIYKGMLDKDMQKKRFDYHCIIEMKALSEIKSWSIQYLTELSRFIINQTQTSSNQSTELAKQFIMENYHFDISLEDVANHVYLHPIYFSRMFKQSTGMNYIDFLTKVRIQKAISLLQSGEHKIYEIPEKVGYKNREYFTRIFKQVTGKSPKQYLIHSRFKETPL
ncbi:response regulator transcription factor [Paenibacillus sp. GXUN7292]|uniref:response regulator transcription factor n=1 Tax=Paenibacillus sp. GXUN7292 TaxID=3422499 RepID=UPI003D7DBBA4